MKSLTRENIFALAPAAFAEAPHPERTEKYSVVTTWNIIEALMDHGWAVREAQQVRGRTAVRQGTNRHMIRLFREDQSMTLNDSQVEILLTNSVNGATAYRLGVGFYKFACMNGLVVHDGIFAEARFFHLESIVKDVVEKTFEIVSQGVEIAEHVAILKETYTHEQRRLEFADYVARDLLKNEHLESRRLLNARREADRGLDAWTVFNVVQENATKGGVEYALPYVKDGENKIRHMTTRPVNEIRVNTNLNRGIWKAAEDVLLAA